MAESKNPDPSSSSFGPASDSYVKGVRYPNPPEPAIGGFKKVRYPNPPDRTNPDIPTLRDQWKFATKLLRKWQALSWTSVLLTGSSVFALGWFIKGSNPLFFEKDDPSSSSPVDSSRAQ